MGVRWIKHTTHFSLLVMLVVFLEIKGCCSLNSEGLALLEFRESVDSDPHGVLANWDPNHDNPCKWSGVYCVNQKVQILVLSKNQFSGFIPKEIGQLTMLEVLDLRNNPLNEIIPVELTGLRSLKQLFIDNNLFEGEIPSDEKNACLSRKLRLCVWMRNNKEKALVGSRRRMLLLQGSNGNIAAIPASGSIPGPIVAVPISRSSGSFSAVPSSTELAQNGLTGSNSAGEKESSGNRWKCIAIGIGSVFILLIIVAVMIFLCRTKAVPHIVPWKTGLSGQLQKAFVTGVPKLNQGELQAACEDFSNIIDTIEGCTVYKGTLSSGVEIAVAVTEIASSKDWSRHMERAYRKKIDTLCRVNHKNFVNLIGFCEEQHPFTRMLVFEYSPNGRLSEHLHVKELEHLDWNMRMRIIMGISYCLQYMHDLNPPVTHTNLNCKHVFLTDDYAAKIAEIIFKNQTLSSRNQGEEDSSHSGLPPSAEPETNVYSFGIILLEIISGKVPFEESGALCNWVAEYLSGMQNINTLTDPTLESFKTNQLNVIGEVIMLCTQGDPKKRPSMVEVTSKLREVIPLSPEQAVARLSPLWWAELEILSSEAA
ncbi:protein MALE DISCOVERER 1-like [Impatiens glandulifera]|uniref:protein MALE DISCOVERER 1-like n=1 Tax=Impatiens glandulifera TaxID=253017 RepID=UPI001FB13F58|nr:protein MALE DISCOVERER 1-like [Impatiens glandulifera]XP_047338185.1 protein MALE DISCOVERER 1-like [Impatiens glandulifera]XP_047338186.1 protein MALE DISCOVERER 1-like [Impatiens glandulifera]